MIYSVNFADLTEKINPLAFAKYLNDTGWKQYPTKKSYIKIYQIINENEEAFQIVIPTSKDLHDYKSSMLQAIETVALVEGKSTEELFLFLLNPNTDILKIRLDKQDIEAGNILFDDAIRVYENAKKLIAATAQDILHPKRFHQGRIDDAILTFINNCKFGQTEIGSYVISVVCPFAELDNSSGYQQLSIFSSEDQCADSLTRRVTNRVMTNIETIKSHIDNGEYESLISDDESEQISANFFESLVGLNLCSEGTNIGFTAQWSPAVKKNRCQTDHVMLTHDYYQPIVTVIQKLRDYKNTRSKIVGRIKKLESSPDLEKRTSGKITVVYLDENEKKRTISANLAKEDYEKAIEAHSSGHYIEIIGDIATNNSRGTVMSCESFNVIE